MIYISGLAPSELRFYFNPLFSIIPDRLTELQSSVFLCKSVSRSQKPWQQVPTVDRSPCPERLSPRELRLACLRCKLFTGQISYSIIPSRISINPSTRDTGSQADLYLIIGKTGVGKSSILEDLTDSTGHSQQSLNCGKFTSLN